MVEEGIKTEEVEETPDASEELLSAKRELILKLQALRAEEGRADMQDLEVFGKILAGHLHHS